MDTCKIDDCAKPAKNGGMCYTHYERCRKHGDGPRCEVEGCTKPIQGRRMCNMHYERWRRHGSTDPRKKSGRPPKPKKPCSIEDCAKDSASRGWCHAHYMAWQRYGHPLGAKHKPVTPEPETTPELSGFLAARRARLARQNRTTAA